LTGYRHTASKANLFGVLYVAIAFRVIAGIFVSIVGGAKKHVRIRRQMIDASVKITLNVVEWNNYFYHLTLSIRFCTIPLVKQRFSDREALWDARQ